MSNLVDQIISSAETLIESEIGFEKAKHYWFLEKNDAIKTKNRYAFTPRSASVVDGLTKTYTVDQSFRVTLMRGYRNNSNSDTDLQAEIKTLYNNADEVIKAFHLNKVGLPSIILSVNLSSIDEPEILEENKLVALNCDFIIKYRNTVD